MTHTHSSYGLRRNLITYNIKITLPHLGAIMFIELHVTRLFNESGRLVVDSIGMRVRSITNKYALICLSLKLRQTRTFLKNETLTPEDPKILDVGLLPGDDFIRSFVQDLAEIKTVSCMTSSVDGLCRTVVWTLQLRHHCSCCINQSAILPLRNTILLRGISSEILMFDPLISKEFIQGVVLELGAVVTSNCQNI